MSDERVRAILEDVFDRRNAHHLEELVSTIADLSTAVSNLASAVAALPAPATGTVIDPADQATLDSAVSELDTVVTTLQGLATPPAPTA